MGAFSVRCDGREAVSRCKCEATGSQDGKRQIQTPKCRISVVGSSAIRELRARSILRGTQGRPRFRGSFCDRVKWVIGVLQRLEFLRRWPRQEVVLAENCPDLSREKPTWSSVNRRYDMRITATIFLFDAQFLRINV